MTWDDGDSEDYEEGQFTEGQRVFDLVSHEGEGDSNSNSNSNVEK